MGESVCVCVRKCLCVQVKIFVSAFFFRKFPFSHFLPLSLSPSLRPQANLKTLYPIQKHMIDEIIGLASEWSKSKALLEGEVEEREEEGEGGEGGGGREKEKREKKGASQEKLLSVMFFAGPQGTKEWATLSHSITHTITSFFSLILTHAHSRPHACTYTRPPFQL